MYYRVNNATISIANVENAHHSTRLLAQTTLRNVCIERGSHVNYAIKSPLEIVTCRVWEKGRECDSKIYFPLRNLRMSPKTIFITGPNMEYINSKLHSGEFWSVCDQKRIQSQP